MGLDITFKAEPFKKIIGVSFASMSNGTQEELEEELKDPLHDPGYVDWLKKRSDVVKIPNYPHWRDYYEDRGYITIRANKWGELYKPLTELLKDHNIEWSES